MVQRLGAYLMDLADFTGKAIFLAGHAARGCCIHRRAVHRLFRQMSRIGVDSLPVVSLMAVFVGMVLALQSGYALSKFGTEGNLGPIVELSIVRELAPVLTALLLAGRIGSSIAAEIGTMAVDEEIYALRTLRIDPGFFLVTPCVYAAMIMLPLLVVYADFIGIFGGGVVASSYFNVPMSTYLDQVYTALSFSEIARGLVKATLFGFLISVISCQQGLLATGGAEGVGRVTIKAVVFSFVSIFVSNYFATRLWL